MMLYADRAPTIGTPAVAADGSEKISNEVRIVVVAHGRMRRAARWRGMTVPSFYFANQRVERASHRHAPGCDARRVVRSGALARRDGFLAFFLSFFLSRTNERTLRTDSESLSLAGAATPVSLARSLTLSRGHVRTARRRERERRHARAEWRARCDQAAAAALRAGDRRADRQGIARARAHTQKEQPHTQKQSRSARGARRSS